MIQSIGFRSLGHVVTILVVLTVSVGASAGLPHEHLDTRQLEQRLAAIDTELDQLARYRHGEQALRKLRNMPEQDFPDVILLDLSLLGMSGLQALPEFCALVPKTKIVILSHSEKEAEVMHAISHGADGYLLKSSSLEEVEDGIQIVMEGGSPLDASVARHLLNTLHGEKPAPVTSLLTERDVTIVTLLADGMVKKEIGAQLGISTFTVNAHLRNIYEKLEVPNVPTAISKAYRSGILPPEGTRET